MAVEKLKNVKFANSVRLSNIENLYYTCERADISLDGIVVKLVDRNTQDTIYSSLMNVVCFVKLEDSSKEEKPKK